MTYAKATRSDRRLLGYTRGLRAAGETGDADISYDDLIHDAARAAERYASANSNAPVAALDAATHKLTCPYCNFFTDSIAAAYDHACASNNTAEFVVYRVDRGITGDGRASSDALVAASESVTDFNPSEYASTYHLPGDCAICNAAAHFHPSADRYTIYAHPDPNTINDPAHRPDSRSEADPSSDGREGRQGRPGSERAEGIDPADTHSTASIHTCSDCNTSAHGYGRSDDNANIT